MMFKELFKITINKFLKLFNLQLNRITLSNNFYYHIVRTLVNYNIDLVLDIGANEGQFAKKIIQYGYNKEILSFEPIKSVHKQLLINSKKYQNWKIYKSCAFGKSTSTKKINISKNTVSSSFLKINKIHLDIEPNAEFVGKENVKLLSLNNFLNKKKFRSKKIFIKIDTQGYEKNIILGGNKVLNKVTGIMIETAISKVYKSEAIYLDMIKLMKKFGFKIWSIERGFTNKKTGQVLQMDIIFINKNEF